jgi:hypothetical protein
MPIFSDEEYRDFDLRPDLREAQDRLPVVMRVDHLELQWLGPLVDLGHDVWMGELANAAWGHLEGCGWQRILADAGDPLAPSGRVRTTWAKAFGRAARALADAGGWAGPEGSPHRWASWLAFEMSDIRDIVKARAEAKGWDR